MAHSKTALVLGVLIVAASQARADVINLATGLDSSGNVWATGDGLDANWAVTSADDPENYGSGYTVFPNNADWYGGWVANSTTSDWIAGNPNVTANGPLTATRTFSLDASQLAGATFADTAWTLDDGGTLTLNGHQLDALSGGNWGSLHSITIDPSFLIAGTNTLTMQITDTDNFLEGERFEGTLTVQGRVLTPEPVTMSLGFAGIALFARRRARAKKS